MPTRPPRMCAKCYQTAESGSSYCAAHRNSRAVADQQRKAADPLRKLYNCRLWRVLVRNSVLSRCDGQCEELMDGTRCMQLATEIDHVVPAEQWVAQGGDFYDEENLRGMCKAHHTGRHKRGGGE